MAATIPTCDSGEIVRLMSEPSTYPDRPGSIQVMETHISWVFLTDRYAYKLKKPVRFDFVDFSQSELRHHACQDELRLNRRLAGDVYISVLPITIGHRGSLSLAGDGQPVDWVVKMRRLPADKSLNEVLLDGRLTPDDEHAVARHLADFYARLPPKRISPHDYRHQLRRHIRANGEALVTLLPSSEQLRTHRTLDSQLRYLAVHADLFDKRVAEGRIVEGHGDLRPEHIYLERPPVVIDCIEFSADLRTIDVADDLGFLAMECNRIGHPGTGRLVLDTYENICGDQIPQALLAFHQSYRACVRAKVVGLQARQRIDQEQRALTRLVHQYVDWAEHFALELGRPLLLIVGGMMGTGKSTLAQELADSLGAKLLSTDQIRRSLFGASPTAAGYGEGNYQPDHRQRVYDDLLGQAATILDQGRSAVLDGSFLKRALRQQATQLGVRHGAIPLCIECQCSRQTALSRIETRASAGGAVSEARVELYDEQVNESEPVAVAEPAITLDTTRSLSDQILQVCGEVRRRGEIGGAHLS
jgi:aminoglycoside phosphotransferase family enzyme/predicted kinase